MSYRRTGMPRAVAAAVCLAALATLPSCAGVSTGSAAHARRDRGWDPPGPRHDPWGPWINEAAALHGIPPEWVRAVMRQESGGRPSAMSPAGAIGLMQVMPRTYAALRARHGLGPDPYKPWDNIMAGTAYLREMHDRFGSPMFLAAYNAGPNRVLDHLRGGRPLPRETRDYLASVAPRLTAGGGSAMAAAGARVPTSRSSASSSLARVGAGQPRPAAVHPDLAWSVQVGAFPTAGDARSVAESAMRAAGGALDGASAAVGEVRGGGGASLYRARVVGVSADAASAACGRLQARGMACVIVPPGGWRS